MDSPSPSPSPSPTPTFDERRHINYFVNCLKKLPYQYSAQDTNRLTLAYFAIQSLDVLKFFDDAQNLELYGIDPTAIIEWIYSLQTSVLQPPPSRNHTKISSNPINDSHCDPNWKHCGFKGGTYLGPQTISSSSQEWCKYDGGHIAMNYVALCTLTTLGDDLSRVDKRSIVRVIKESQLDNGSFTCTLSGSESDLRFVYCACAISYMLDDWSGVDVSKTLNYIRRCRSWDGGIGLSPGKEGHGGSAFLATASLDLMGRMEEVLDEELGGGGSGGGDTWRGELIRWCVSRQGHGIQGRPNKREDTCYSFWIGGTLKLLGCVELLDTNRLNRFVMDCQTDLGGFSKFEGRYPPDVLHSFYSLAWLSLNQQSSLIDRVENFVDTVDDCRQSGDNGTSTTGVTLPALNELDCRLGIVTKRTGVF